MRFGGARASDPLVRASARLHEVFGSASACTVHREFSCALHAAHRRRGTSISEHLFTGAISTFIQHVPFCIRLPQAYCVTMARVTSTLYPPEAGCLLIPPRSSRENRPDPKESVSLTILLTHRLLPLQEGRVANPLCRFVPMPITSRALFYAHEFRAPPGRNSAPAI